MLKQTFLLTFLALLAIMPASKVYADTTPLPRLHVVGNHLTLPDGKATTLHGVSLCSLEWHNPLGQIEEVTHSSNAWPVSVLRLPVQPQEWDREGADHYIQDRLDPAVALCKRNGVYCIIDWHAIDSWKNPAVAGKLQGFWQHVAGRYANDANILYELFNEPTDPGNQTRENWLAWRETASHWIDTIRVVAPNTVILVGSPHWSQLPSFAAADPFPEGNLLYVMHLYPNLKPRQWDDLFGTAAARIPVFISEWGWSSQWAAKGQVFYGTKESFGDPFRAYVDARPQVSWTAWSYDPQCGPAMQGKDQDLADFVKQWLTDLHKKGD